MSMRVAILEQSTRGQAKRTVVNVIVLDDMSEVPDGFDGIESSDAGPGDLWDGASFLKFEN